MPKITIQPNRLQQEARSRRNQRAQLRDLQRIMEAAANRVQREAELKKSHKNMRAIIRTIQQPGSVPLGIMNAR